MRALALSVMLLGPLCAPSTLAPAFLGVAQAGAQRLEGLFEEGNAAVFREDYAAAIEAYRRLEEFGVEDADVAFNLATAYARSGALGRAVQYYERALRIRPGDRDAGIGLEATRARIAQQRAEQEGEALIHADASLGQAILRPFPESTLAVALLVAEGIFFLLWLVRRRVHGRVRLGVTLGMALVGTLFVAMGLGLLGKRGLFTEGSPAIIIRDRVAVREGPDPRATERAEAREGDPATVLDVDHEHVRVRVAGGSEGWVRRSDVGHI